jgi:predicted phosphate transport protein (TIGR00153 family)
MINLLPRDTAFFDLFEDLTEHVIQAAGELRSLAHEFPNTNRQVERIRDLEHAADAITHTALERLDRTFITPFDREDIHRLVEELDDIVDSIDFLAKRFALYKFKQIEDDFKKQTDVLYRAVGTLKNCVQRLRRSRKLIEFTPDLKAIGQLEKEGDANNHAAVARMFSDPAANPIEVMKWKEFYDRIETAIDGCEDVGNTLESIVLKNA